MADEKQEKHSAWETIGVEGALSVASSGLHFAGKKLTQYLSRPALIEGIVQGWGLARVHSPVLWKTAGALSTAGEVLEARVGKTVATKVIRNVVGKEVVKRVIGNRLVGVPV